jgi:molecular chaperone GrpE
LQEGRRERCRLELEKRMTKKKGGRKDRDSVGADAFQAQETSADEADAGAGASDSDLPEGRGGSRQEAEDLRERLLRLQAEFENYKKRQSRERGEQRRNVHVGVLKEFLPILDNLERAVDLGDVSDPGKIVEGVQLVLKQLKESFTKFGVTRMESRGEMFDPHVHEAMSRVETDGDPPDGTVVEVYQEGFLLDGSVLRPAMVGVAKIVDGAAEEPEA